MDPQCYPVLTHMPSSLFYPPGCVQPDWTDRPGWTDMTGQAGHAAPCVARLRGVFVPKACQHLPGSLEHPDFCLESLVYVKCVKLGLILPQSSSPLLLSQAVCLTPFRSGVPGDGGKSREAIWLKATLPQKKRVSPMGIRSLIQPTTRRRAVPGNCVDFPSEKQLAGSDLSSSGSQRAVNVIKGYCRGETPFPAF